MYKKNIFLKQFLLLHACFVVHKMQSSYTFETRINENLTLYHTYPQQIISKMEINVNELLDILLPEKNARPSIDNWITKNQNTFTLDKVVFLFEQNIVAIYNQKYVRIDVFDRQSNGYVCNMLLEKDLKMQGFFLAYYSDKETRPNEAVPHLLIVYKTKKAGICYIVEKKIGFPYDSPPLSWRLVQANYITAIKDNYIKCVLDTTEFCQNFLSIPCHSTKEALEKKNKSDSLDQFINSKTTHYKPILIFSGSFLILFLILWYKYS